MKRDAIEFDAWSSGQIGSKIWLCEKLEEVSPFSRQSVIWCLGGWYGMLGFLLLSRGKLPIERIRSFDLDPEATKVANLINENWVWREWKFKAVLKDCDKLDFTGKAEAEPAPDIVLNTSVEHFQTTNWWSSMPSGQFVVLQSNNMQHEDHLFLVQSEDELLETFPMSEVYFKGSLKFEYPTHSFTRFMIIGKKR